MGESCFLSTLLTWSIRRWFVAAVAASIMFVGWGIPTAVIANPVFGRAIAPTDWAMNALIVTSVMSGLLVATYVRNRDHAPISPALAAPADRTARRGAIGGLLAYLAIGCPVCNKVVLVALGSTGAVQIFAPVQPYLAATGVVVLAWALVVRLRGEMTCSLGTPARALGQEAATRATETTHAP